MAPPRALDGASNSYSPLWIDVSPNVSGSCWWPATRSCRCVHHWWWLSRKGEMGRTKHLYGWKTFFFLRLYCKGKVIVMRAAFYEVSWTTIFLPTLRDPWVCWIPTTALRGFPFHFVFQAQVLQTIHILLQSTRSESTLFCNLTAGWYLKLRLHWPTGWPSMLAASNWSETWHIWRLQVVFGSPWSPPRNQVVAADYDFRSLDLIKSINQPPPNKWMLVFFIHFFR